MVHRHACEFNNNLGSWGFFKRNMYIPKFLLKPKLSLQIILKLPSKILAINALTQELSAKWYPHAGSIWYRLVFSAQINLTNIMPIPYKSYLILLLANYSSM